MEENRPEHLDKFFTDALQSFEDHPAREVWEKIEQELDGDKRRRYFPIVRPFSLIAACLLALCIAIGILFHTDRKTDLAHRSEVFHKKDSRPGTSTIATANLPASQQERLSHSSTPVKSVAAFSHSTPDPMEPRPMQYTLPPFLQPLQAGIPRMIADIPQLLNGRSDRFKKDNLVHLVTPLRRWSIAGYFSQELAGYNLADHDSIGARHQEIDKKETSLFSASAGVLVGYQLTKKWLLQTGFLYSWSSSLGDPSTAYAVTDNNGKTKYQLNTIVGYGYLPSSSPAGDSVKTDQSSTRLHYLSIPVIASYTFHKRQFTFLAGAGLIGNFLTGATVSSRVEEASTPQPESIVALYGLRKINYGLLFKTEAQFAIRPDWSLDVIVTSKNALTAINTNANYSTYPSYIGVGLGIKHNF